MPLDPLLKSLGSQIRRTRVAQDLSQEKLAELSGLHRTYIGGVEGGLRNPSVKSLARIAKALDVEIPDLFPARSKAR